MFCNWRGVGCVLWFGLRVVWFVFGWFVSDIVVWWLAAVLCGLLLVCWFLWLFCVRCVLLFAALCLVCACALLFLCCCGVFDFCVCVCVLCGLLVNMCGLWFGLICFVFF